MAARAIWRGHLSVGELICSVTLHGAASEGERISFHIINRETGHRVRRRFVDGENGKPVEDEDIVKGYETPDGDFVILDPEEVKAAVPESDKRLEMQAFIACNDVDTTFFERPYFVAPADEDAADAYALIRDAMEEEKVAGLARTVLFRRVRTLLVRPHGEGMIATTLNFDYEVRSDTEIFEEISDIRVSGEMLDLARHIIETKMGRFEPSAFDDRYEQAVAELVKAKLAGRRPKKLRKVETGKVTDLMEALRRSAGAEHADRKRGKTKATGREAGQRRKAG
ncbi:Ku protein [Ciceribacter ferrooxidans]|uniref:Non-homologous end joining protein Ku n=1 Tax=Ciceribacter ferrooxidans TaxID=2509717 RepID=A0A4Q2SX71_9HYPH|nr:Ku protein [Ciceribacter ferrooxidans]RYC10213.1 Ku protein [Ciceribacter ferrooxidans]